MTNGPEGTWTLQDTVAWLFERIDAGTECPCCGQFVKVYANRKITGAMARVLVEMYRRARGDWVSLPQICNDLRIGSRGDQTRLRAWGLIEKLPGRREDGGPSRGVWRLTPLGVDFVCGRITVTKYAKVYDNTALEFHGPQVGIRDCLSARFNYDELMGGE